MENDDNLEAHEENDEEYMDAGINTSVGTSDTPDVSMNRSGQIRKQHQHIGVDAFIQTDPAVPDRPRLLINSN